MNVEKGKPIVPEEPLDICDSRRDGARSLNDDLIQILKDYADKLASDLPAEGRFEQSQALPDEGDEADLVDLPRLVFACNRRNHGRLRQLIDCLNRGEVT